jgi:hypothetical protein
MIKFHITFVERSARNASHHVYRLCYWKLKLKIANIPQEHNNKDKEIGNTVQKVWFLKMMVNVLTSWMTYRPTSCNEILEAQGFTDFLKIQKGDMNQVTCWEPTILECPVNLTVIGHFLVYACELTFL